MSPTCNVVVIRLFCGGIIIVVSFALFFEFINKQKEIKRKINHEEKKKRRHTILNGLIYHHQSFQFCPLGHFAQPKKNEYIRKRDKKIDKGEEERREEKKGEEEEGEKRREEEEYL